MFGQTVGTAIELSAVAAGAGGFVINGQSAGDSSGISVAGAGVAHDSLRRRLVVPNDNKRTATS